MKIRKSELSLSDLGYDERLGVWYNEWEKGCDWNMIEGGKHPKIICVLDFANFVINKINSKTKKSSNTRLNSHKEKEIVRD